MTKPRKETKVWSLRKTTEEQRNEGVTMAMKTTAVQAEIKNGGLAEIHAALNSMSEQISKIANQQIKLMGLFEDVQKLQKQLQEKDEVIRGLERRIDQLEQYTRMEEVVIAGLKTTHRSYASAVRGDGDMEAPTTELETLERQVLKFLAEKNIKVQSCDVAACYTLPNKGRSIKPAAIVMRFTNRKHKMELLKQSMKLKGTGVFLNEHLTKRNADIARHARMLRKEKKIQGTWTRDCRVMIRLNGASPEEAKVVMVRELKDLEKYR